MDKIVFKWIYLFLVCMGIPILATPETLSVFDATVSLNGTVDGQFSYSAHYLGANSQTGTRQLVISSPRFYRGLT